MQVFRGGWIFSVPELLERCRTLRKYLIQEEDWQETGGNKAYQIMSNQETATPNLYYFKQVQSRSNINTWKAHQAIFCLPKESYSSKFMGIFSGSNNNSSDNCDEEQFEFDGPSRRLAAPGMLKLWLFWYSRLNPSVGISQKRILNRNRSGFEPTWSYKKGRRSINKKACLRTLHYIIYDKTLFSR